MIMGIKWLISKIQRSSVRPALVLGHGRSTREIFRDIYTSNYWGGLHSHSGTGSDLVQTAEVRLHLPALIQTFHVQTMLDIPCGDWHWMKETALNVDYIGADIVPELVQRNQERYGNDRCRFMTLDLRRDDLPKVDLVFSRDVLVHLSFEDVFAALNNVRRSGSEYFLVTTFTGREGNSDIPTGHWRPLNLQKSPFNLPKPLIVINEKCGEGDGSWGDKSLGLWRVDDLCTVPS